MYVPAQLFWLVHIYECVLNKCYNIKAGKQEKSWSGQGIHIFLIKLLLMRALFQRNN